MWPRWVSLCRTVCDRFVIAPFVYSICTMAIQDGNYSFSTFCLSHVCEMIVYLPCTEFLFYGIVCAIDFVHVYWNT